MSKLDTVKRIEQWAEDPDDTIQIVSRGGFVCLECRETKKTLYFEIVLHFSKLKELARYQPLSQEWSNIDREPPGVNE